MQRLTIWWCTDIYLVQAENFRIWQKSGLTFRNTSLMSDMYIVAMQLVMGCQLLVMDPTSLLQQSLVNTVPHIVMVHWYLLVPVRELHDLTKILPNFSQHIIDVWHVHSGYVTCKGLPDLGNGPNKPTATIIGKYSASLQDAALVFTLVRARISDSDNNSATLFTTHHWCLASSQCVCSL